MVWAVHALQTGREKHGGAYISYPKEAVTSEMGNKYSIYPWAIETIIGALLCTPKYKQEPGRRFRKLDCSKFQAVAAVYNLLLNLENVEYGLKLRNNSVIEEIPRIGHRQFEWQRGFVCGSLFYRYALMYGGAATSAHFQARRGVALDKFMLVGLSLMSIFQMTPWILQPATSQIAGLTGEEVRAAIAAISIPLKEARLRASGLRLSRNEIAYRPSVLREFPCVSFGNSNERLRAPLPDLIALRCTSGLFYDFIGAGSHIRNEIAERFETYCLSFIRHFIGAALAVPQMEYRYKKNNIKSPDILIRRAL